MANRLHSEDCYYEVTEGQSSVRVEEKQVERDDWIMNSWSRRDGRIEMSYR